MLAGKLPAGQRPSTAQVDLAVRYFLAELPLFLDTPSVVGTTAYLFCYHQPPETPRRLYGRGLILHPAAGQGFGVVTPVEPTVTATAGSPPPSSAVAP